jgi:hypothetical protein
MVGMAGVSMLDWLHLGKQVRELMRRIAPTTAEKVTALKLIFYPLWHGQTEAVLDYLRTVVKTKNPEKLAALIGSREKHQVELID